MQANGRFGRRAGARGGAGPALCLLLAGWILGGPGVASVPAQGGPPSRADDPRAAPLQVLARWTADYRRLGASLDPAADDRLRPALEELRRRLAGSDAGENDALLALCDLAALGGSGSADPAARGEPGGGGAADEREARVRSSARSVLRSALDAAPGAGRGDWLATQVVALGERHPLARRIAAAEALCDRHWETTELALLTAAGAPERGLREAAVRALNGWNSEAVDRYLLGLALRALREPAFLDPATPLEHFARRKLGADDVLAVRLAAGLGAAASAENWRTAVARLPLTRVLPDELALPLLVETLGLWARRGEAGASSRRVESAVVRELERRSNVKLGMSAERWSTWWKATRLNAAGGTPRPEGGAEQTARTRASFFGLRPWTDRVVFVIDRSGSMANTFGTGSTSRYAEALRQLEQILVELGPRTHFSVVLFSDEAHGWRSDLRPATSSAIASALQWARAMAPRGGTRLAPAIRAALQVDPRTGRPDLAKLEADTVIVLCDGATEEGPAWARDLLRTTAADTGIQFDCVQIGASGNGMLEVLAESSGGQFVRTDG